MKRIRHTHADYRPPTTSVVETLAVFAALMLVFVSAVVGVPYLLLTLAVLGGATYALRKRD